MCWAGNAEEWRKQLGWAAIWKGKEPRRRQLTFEAKFRVFQTPFVWFESRHSRDFLYESYFYHKGSRTFSEAPRESHGMRVVNNLYSFKENPFIEFFDTSAQLELCFRSIYRLKIKITLATDFLLNLIEKRWAKELEPCNYRKTPVIADVSL